MSSISSSVFGRGGDNRRRPVIALLCLAARLGAVQGVDLYVAVNGSDSNSGAIGAPFASIQHCADLLSSLEKGSTCWLRGGEYHVDASVLIEDLHGNATHPYMISGYADEEVILDGTFDLNPSSSWSWDAAGEFWVTTLPQNLPDDPWQLWVNGEPMVNARW